MLKVPIVKANVSRHNLNCKLDFKFTETVNQVSLKIGAGILENAVYFKFKRE